MDSTTDWISAIAASVSAVVTAGGIVFALLQLRNLKDTLRMNGLMAVINMEAEINRRQERAEDAAARAAKEQEDQTNGVRPKNRELITQLSNEMKSRIESYLNSVDRLAFMIRKGYLNDKEWQTEYHEFIVNVVRGYPDYFKEGTIYTNTSRLARKWLDGE
jgi:hypothetical protein